MPTTTLTFYGDTGGHAFDGFAGFRIGQTYELTYTQEFDEVLVQLPHAPGRTAKMTAEEFKKWFRK
jgi:hypothetical protein